MSLVSLIIGRVCHSPIYFVERFSKCDTHAFCSRRQNNVQSESGEDATVESSSSGSSGATKRRGETPLGLATEDSSEEESPRVGKVRRYGVEVSLENVKLEGIYVCMYTLRVCAKKRLFTCTGTKTETGRRHTMNLTRLF